MCDTKDKTRDTDVEDMLPLWQQMYREGAEFFLEGEQMLPAEVLSRAVKEDGVYMADYVFGEAGKIEQVRFDKVVPEQP